MPPDETMRLESLVERSGLMTVQLWPLVRRLEDHLAAVIHRVVVERIDRERWCPVTAVLGFVRRRVEGVHPGTHRPRAPGAGVVSRHLVAVARSPDDVRVGVVGNGEAGFAAAKGAFPRGAAEAAPATAEPAAEPGGRRGIVRGGTAATPSASSQRGIGRRSASRRGRCSLAPTAACAAVPAPSSPASAAAAGAAAPRDRPSSAAPRARHSARAWCRCPGDSCRPSTAPGCPPPRDTSVRSAARP